jgi:pyruvate formate lyase activating enzyme
MDRLMDTASPERIAQVASAQGCRSIAFTYNDPVIFAEYALDCAHAAHAAGLQTVAVTAGYIHAQPRQEFYAAMDAANVDLKGFTEDFYFKQTGAHLAPVLETLEYIHHETDCWLEITTLIIPGHNDSDAELDAMTRWIAAHLGMDVPLHFTAFHPDYKMMDVAPTPPSTLQRARRIGMNNGLNYVYTGNVHDTQGGTTFCPGCGEALIVRDWYRILEFNADDHGACGACGTNLAGHFAAFTGSFGRRRIPVRVGV